MRSPHSLAMLMLAIATSIASPAAARTWIIEPDGSGDAPTIRAGIDSSEVGDTLLLGPGTFKGPDNRDLQIWGHGITVTSMKGAESTIIDCEDLGRAFQFSGHDLPDSRLSGVTIRNGRTETTGGGVEIRDTEPEITNCTFVDCLAVSGGGGINVDQNRPQTISPVIRSCDFIRCLSRWGGGIWIEDSSPLVEGNTFQECLANEGAGMYITEESLDPLVTGHPTITSNTIFNCGHENTLRGGGILVRDMTGVTFTGNILYGNQADEGGGMYIEGSGNLVFTSNTVSENLGRLGGSGVYLLNTNAILSRMIVSHNTGSAGLTCSGGSPGLDCGIVFGNDDDTLCGTTTDVNVVDPQFCGSTGSHIYEIQTDSPAAPANSPCGELIGALGVGCGSTPTLESTWGGIKSRYR